MRHEGPSGGEGRRIRVKICGLTRREDALLAAGEGADYLGVVLVPESPRAVLPARAREVAGGLGLPVVAVVADLDPATADRVGRDAGATVLQLHGSEPPETVAELRDRGGWTVWKALRVRGRRDLEEGLAAFAGVADALLLDGWHPTLKGGAGVAFSWPEAERVQGLVPPHLPLIVAGGLTSKNVSEAVGRLDPWGVDVSSGVEVRPGVKDPQEVRAFLRAVRGG